MFKWNKADLIAIPITLLIICVLAVGLYFLLRNRSPKIKRIPLQIISVFMVVFEIAKQAYFHGRPEYTNYILPIHFCSLILLLMPLAQCCGEKMGRIFRPMAFIYSALVVVLLMANPHALIGYSAANIFGSFRNAHNYIFHFTVVAYLAFSIALGDYIPKFIHCVNLICGVVFYGTYALPCAYLLKENFCNILYSYFGPLEKFRLWAGQKQYWVGQLCYNLVLFLVAVIGLSALCAITCLIYKAVLKIKERIKEKKGDSLQASADGGENGENSDESLRISADGENSGDSLPISADGEESIKKPA